MLAFAATCLWSFIHTARERTARGELQRYEVEELKQKATETSWDSSPFDTLDYDTRKLFGAGVITTWVVKSNANASSHLISSSRFDSIPLLSFNSGISIMEPIMNLIKVIQRSTPLPGYPSSKCHKSMSGLWRNRQVNAFSLQKTPSESRGWCPKKRAAQLQDDQARIKCRNGARGVSCRGL